MTVLVTGGAGYIGSHMAHALVDRGEAVVVVDNLSTGNRGLVPAAATFVEADIADGAKIRDVIARHSAEAIIHFAGSIIVPESVENPLLYYRNNTAATRNLLEAAVSGGVTCFIFSSTAAVYADGADEPIREEHPTSPASPYGRSKLMTEWMLQDAAAAYDFRYVALRYFNVAGADPAGRTGQSNPNATHLIKRACQAALGQIPRMDIFGTDYPTRDGTGVRDYIHVSDLVAAHVLALDHLRNGGASATFNCGYGHGTTVREVIACAQRLTNGPIPVRESPRRPGDAASVIADSSRIKASLGWTPRHDDLEEIIRSAYEWERRQRR